MAHPCSGNLGAKFSPKFPQFKDLFYANWASLSLDNYLKR